MITRFSSGLRRTRTRSIILPVLLVMLFASSAVAGTGGTDYERFGQSISAALNAGDAKTITRALDKEAILDRALDGITQRGKTVDELRSGLGKGLDQAGALLTRNLSENARTTFVRARSVNGEHHALMRVDLGDKGLNYMDFVLHKDRTGSVKVIDWYDYAQGQLYTDGVRQLIVLMMPQERTLLEKLLRVKGIDQRAAREVMELARLLREQKYAEWLKTYDGLSKDLKKSRVLLISRVLLAGAVGDDGLYRRALRDVHTYLGDDPTLGLVLIDYYFYEEDYDAAQAALTRLAKYTGGDAAIDRLRANISLAAGNYSESMTFARSAIGQDRAYEDSYWTLLEASVLAKKYETTVGVLRSLEKDFGYDLNPETVRTMEGYEAFADSVAFAKWKESQ
jgi:hypothetical protein